MKTPDRVQLVSVYPVLRFVVGKSRSTGWIVARLITAASLPGILVLYGAWHDDALRLPCAAKGLFEHYGFLTFFVTTPTIAILSWQILKHLVAILRKLPRFLINGEVPSRLRRRARYQWRSLALRWHSKWVLLLFSAIGVYFVILNIRRTRHPLDTYNTDVFDSSAHHWAFVMGKIYLVFTNVLLYPIAIFVCLHTTITLVAILHLISKEGLLKLDFFHPDNCGGLSEFGYVNVLVMGVYACFGANIVALFKTHDYRHNIQALPMVVLSILTIVQSFLALYYLSKSIRAKKDEALRSLNQRLSDHLKQLNDSDDSFPDDLLQVRNHLLSIKTYPYAGQVQTVANVLRFAPVTLGILHFLYPSK